MYRDADRHDERLLFNYQDDGEENQGILITDLSGNSLHAITDPYAQGPRWSPDGSKFAYFGVQGLYIHSSADHQLMAVVEIENHDASFCEWSPGGDALIFSAYAVHPFQPPNIYRYDLDDQTITQITNNNNVDRFPKWNSTGSQIACHRTYIGAQENEAGIAIVDLDTKNEQVLPRDAGLSQRISRHCWSADDKFLLLTEGDTHLKIYVTATGELVWSVQHPAIVGGGFNSYNGHVFMVTPDALTLYELPSRTPYAQLQLPVKATLSGPVVAFDEETAYFLGTDCRYYRWRVGQDCEVLLTPETTGQGIAYQRSDYTFRAGDGRNIPVQRSLSKNPTGRAVVFVEGGPGEAINPDDAIVMKLLEEGYEVIRPVYRGCNGYGEEHLNANRAQCGLADVRDVVECGLDWKQRFGDFPLAVSGYSYGGYLTLLAMMHEDAPWECGITFWGCTMVTPLVQTTGLPADPESRRSAMQERSPVRQAHRIRFPLLILHGELDTTASVEEVRQIHDAVSASHIDCRLVIFENESHGLKGCRPEMVAHTLAFLETHMGHPI